MKIIIYTASADVDAKTNFLRLVESRQGNPSIGSNEKHSILEFISGKLVDPKKILEKMKLSDRETLEIEVIAHGSTSNSNELLIMPKEKIRLNQIITYVSITPQTICDFFNEAGKENELYKFKKITLFCCQSLKFGKTLSELMPGVNITCFNEDIRINHDGIAYNGQNQTVAAKLYTFYSGNLLEELKENKAESSNQVQILSSSSSDTLSNFNRSYMNRPYMIRSSREVKYNTSKQQEKNEQTVSNKASPSHSSSSLTETDTEVNESASSSFKPK